MPNFFDKRRAGILLHITSLPGSLGNGNLYHAHAFVDFLKESGLSVWQMLPIHPFYSLADLSPYQPQCIYAGNPLFISLRKLMMKRWLRDEGRPKVNGFLEAAQFRYDRLKKSHQGFVGKADAAEKEAYTDFVNQRAHWLADYALFRALKEKHNQLPWWQWPNEYRNREPQALEKARQELRTAIEQCQFEQFVFFQQWLEFRQYANDRGIYLCGDMPFFVAEDSVEMWANPENFLVDAQSRAEFVAGSPPPDYFSREGQCWGNPVYNWGTLQAQDFQWWIARFKTLHELFDLVRLTHFRGFEACFAIPATEKMVSSGNWMSAPGRALFQTLKNEFGHSDTPLPWITDDILFMAKEVNQLRDEFGLMGIKVLQLAFNSPSQEARKMGNNPHLPHNHQDHSVVYTGTHDSNTTVGWFQNLEQQRKDEVCNRFNAKPEEMPWPLIKAAFGSNAKLAIIPMQDVLGLDDTHRMNTPGNLKDNWLWRFQWYQEQADTRERLRKLAEICERE